MSSKPAAPAASKYLRRAMDPAAEEYYRRLTEEGRLCTTSCPRCRLTSFPPRLRCPHCQAEAEWIELPKRGTLEAFTTQEIALRFPAPAVLALARLGAVLVPGIAGAAYEELRIGQQLEVEPFPEPETGFTLLRFLPLA